MTYANGAPHPGDGRAYSDGGLVGHDVQVDLERRHQQLKLLRELEDAQRQQQQQRPKYSSRPTTVFQLPRGPVIWNSAPAPPAPSSSSSSSIPVPSIAGRAPVPQIAHKRQETQGQEQQQQQDQRRRLAAASAGQVAPSIHTILEIARSSSSGALGQSSSASITSSSSSSLTNSSRYYSKSPNVRQCTSPRGSTSAGIIPGHRPAQDQERDQVSRQQKPSSIPTASTVVPSSSPPQQSVGTVPVGTFGGSGTPLRRGKWTKAEEEFAAATIRYFCGGLLNLQFGTLLRGFLAQQLHCHPMRISKKLLPGTTFCGVEISRKLGRRAYSPRWCDSPLATQQKLDAEDHLAALRAKFIASIEEEEEAAIADDDTNAESREMCRAAERLSETSESRASTGTASAAGSPPSDLKGETTRAGSPAVLLQQQQHQHHQHQQMYQYNQQRQQQVIGQKRSRGDSEWAAVEQRHHPQPQQHQYQQHQQQRHQQPHRHHHQLSQHSQHSQQHSYYSQSHAATSQRWEASPPVRSSPPQLWHSPAPATSPPFPPSTSSAVAGPHASRQPPSYYEDAPPAAKLPRLHHHQHQPNQLHQYQQVPHQPLEPTAEPQRSSVSSPPSLLTLPSLRASLQRASTYHDHQQQQGHPHQYQQHRL